AGVQEGEVDVPHQQALAHASPSGEGGQDVHSGLIGQRVRRVPAGQAVDEIRAGGQDPGQRRVPFGERVDQFLQGRRRDLLGGYAGRRARRGEVADGRHVSRRSPTSVGPAGG